MTATTEARLSELLSEQQKNREEYRLATDRADVTAMQTLRQRFNELAADISAAQDSQAIEAEVSRDLMLAQLGRRHREEVTAAFANGLAAHARRNERYHQLFALELERHDLIASLAADDLEARTSIGSTFFGAEHETFNTRWGDFDHGLLGRTLAEACQTCATLSAEKRDEAIKRHVAIFTRQSNWALQSLPAAALSKSA